MKILSQSLAETEKFAARCLEKLARRAPATGAATTVGLSGELGAGKTTFTQATARVLGIRAVVNSPTFVLIKNYPIPPHVKAPPCQGGWRRLIHIDCYRLSQATDLIRLGWGELAADSANLIFVEWPEQVEGLIPSMQHRIKFEIAGEFSRRILFSHHPIQND